MQYYPFESKVLVEKGTTYEGGDGYSGKMLNRLGFPPGPYTPAVARILLLQARAVDSSLELEIRDYRP